MKELNLYLERRAALRIAVAVAIFVAMAVVAAHASYWGDMWRGWAYFLGFGEDGVWHQSGCGPSGVGSFAGCEG